MSSPWSDDPDLEPAEADEVKPSASVKGIALCLGQLADEAAELGLLETFAAIRQAIGMCLTEQMEVDRTGDRRTH